MRTSNKDPNRLNTLLLTNPLGAYADVCSNGTKSMNNQGDYDISLAVDPLNPEIVWAGGIDVFRSDDGGKNWGIAAFWQISAPKLVHADVHVLAFSPFYNGGDNQTLFAATDGGMYRTDNALAATAKGDRAGCSPYATSVAWTNINGGYAVTQFYHGAIYPGGGAYIAGAQDNGTVRGSDASGPLDWRTAMGGDGGFVAIDPKDPNVWYAETTELSLRRTANGGNSFSTAIRGITEPGANFQFIAPFVMDPSESKRLYIGGRTLWRTTDGAQNWSEASAAIPASSGRISAIAVAPGDPNYMVFGTELGFVFRSDAALSAEKTTTWQSAQPRSGYLSRLAFDPINPEIVYATYSRFKSSAAQSHVYRSTDGGATWTGIDGSGQTGLPDIPVFSIIADPRNPTNLYLGTDIGVFVSLDSGATWSRDDNPFATAVTETLVLDRSAGQSTLFAFTHGRGVWKVTLPGSGDACQYAVSTDSITMPAFGVPVSVDVATGDNCTWSVFSRDNSFAMASPATGQGNGKFTINPGFLNNTTEPSISKILVQDKPIAITQNAALVASGNDDATSPFAMGDLPAVVIGDNRDATESDKDPVHSCTKSADSKTLWFSLTAPAAGSMRLSYQIRRTDNGADAGAVISLYRVVNGAMGPEFGCFVAPQTTSGSALRTVTWPAREGESYLVQLSATTSGAPDGAPLRTGKVTLAATLAQQ